MAESTIKLSQKKISLFYNFSRANKKPIKNRISRKKSKISKINSKEIFNNI